MSIIMKPPDYYFSVEHTLQWSSEEVYELEWYAHRRMRKRQNYHQQYECR